MTLRIVLVVAAAVGLSTATAQAQDGYVGDRGDGVVRVDGAALRQRILADQLTCRRRAIALVSGPVPSTYTPPGPGTPGGMFGVGGDHLFDLAVRGCMGEHGYAYHTPSAVEVRTFQAQGAADPYAALVQYELAPGQVTTVVQDTDASGRTRQTYLVGRF